MGKENDNRAGILETLHIHPVVKSVLLKDLTDEFGNFRSANELDSWVGMKIPPKVPSCYIPNLDASLLERTMEKHKTDKVPLKNEELLNYGIIYSGIHPADFQSREWARLLDVYPQSNSFPFITGELNSRRTPARAIPPTFQADEKLHTPFIGHGSSTREIEVEFYGGPRRFSVGKITKLLPLDSPSVIAYVRRLKGPEHRQDLSITINPLLACGERCAFCYRQYGLLGNIELGAKEKTPLIRIQPEVMARYIRIKFANLDLRKVVHFGLVTGAFKNYDDLYNYLVKFRTELNVEAGQGFTILTHLATSKEQMLGLRDLGVTELQHTMEIFDDSRRREIMPVLSRNTNIVPKYSVSFDKVLSMVKPGQEIFGEGFAVSSILGIDNFTNTINSLVRLRKEGLIKLSFPVYQTYNLEGISLYNMTFPELIEARQMAKSLFIRQY